MFNLKNRFLKPTEKQAIYERGDEMITIVGRSKDFYLTKRKDGIYFTIRSIDLKTWNLVKKLDDDLLSLQFLKFEFPVFTENFTFYNIAIGIAVDDKIYKLIFGNKEIDEVIGDVTTWNELNKYWNDFKPLLGARLLSIPDLADKLKNEKMISVYKNIFFK